MFDEVTCVDMLGFGCSGHPDFKSFEAKKCTEYLVFQLDQWMKATGYDRAELGKFTLIAHSLGCYLSANYAVDNADKIKEMVFISPAAMNGEPPGFDVREWLRNRKTYALQVCFTLYYYIWDWHLSPAAICKIMGYYGSRIVHTAWLKRIKNRNKEDVKAFGSFMLQNALQKTSTDRCMSVLFSFGLNARCPLQALCRDEKLPLRKIKTTFLYGESDEMPRKFADELLVEGVLEPQSKVYTVSNADHHLYINNPEECL